MPVTLLPYLHNDQELHLLSLPPAYFVTEPINIQLSISRNKEKQQILRIKGYKFIAALINSFPVY